MMIYPKPSLQRRMWESIELRDKTRPYLVAEHVLGQSLVTLSPARLPPCDREYCCNVTGAVDMWLEISSVPLPPVTWEDRLQIALGSVSFFGQYKVHGLRPLLGNSL